LDDVAASIAWACVIAADALAVEQDVVESASDARTDDDASEATDAGQDASAAPSTATEFARGVDGAIAHAPIAIVAPSDAATKAPLVDARFLLPLCMVGPSVLAP
jgi:hypothetical protein